MSLLGKILQNFKDILFPIECMECRTEGEWWCEKCRKRAMTTPVFLCPVCARNSDNGRCCVGCRGFTDLDGAVSLCRYEDRGPIGSLIKKFKYNFVSDLSALWQNIADDCVPSMKLADIFSAPFTIVPVPLWPRRLRERGYNQSEILAKIFFDKLKKDGVDCDITSGLLRRIRYTMPQAKLNRDERLINLNGAFVWDGDKAPQNVLLVDDILTTGSTLRECARALKSKGSASVWAFTLARG